MTFIADLQAGILDSEADPDGALVRFLRTLEILDVGPEQPPSESRSGEPTPTSVTLFLTTACNLRCTYCYASAGDRPARFMTLEVALRGIDFVLENAQRSGAPAIRIAYHGGGEPTLNWKVLVGSLEYARRQAAEAGVRCEASTGTNGVLSTERLEWIIANLAGVTLSFDGLPSVHDRHRLTVLGQGSSGDVIRTMERFDAAAYPYGVRMTVTRDQIAELPESAEYICRNFRPRQIQVEPAYQLGRWREAPSAETQEFIAAFREAQARARRLGRELAYSAARTGTLTTHFCGITRDSFALSPDGNVSACYECFSEENELAGVFFYGVPELEGRGYRFDLPVLNRLRAQTVEHRDYCRSCFAKWSCAGDCYHKALTVDGGGAFSGSDRCHITRELTKDQILERIAGAGGLFWHEPPPGWSGGGTPAEVRP